MNTKDYLHYHVASEMVIKYRFSDDPETTVREHVVVPKWLEKYQAFELMPPFEGKSVILL